MKDSITEIKNTLEGMNSRLSDTEEHISDLEDGIVEIKTAKRKPNLKNENSLSDLSDNIKCTNIRNLVVPEGEEREKEIKNIFEEIMV